MRLKAIVRGWQIEARQPSQGIRSYFSIRIRSRKRKYKE